MFGNNEAGIGNSTATGTGPWSARNRFFNPYPVEKYATGGM